MENSKIEWTHHTFNPWVGCTKVSDGCKHCYAEALMDTRMGKVQWGPHGERKRTSAAYWRQPLKWNREAEREGVRKRVFCASLADVFEAKRELDPWREELLHLISACRNLDWLLLTKRPDKIDFLIRVAIGYGMDRWYAENPHVWQGVSVEDRLTADERIPQLLRYPAAVRFLSCEPLLSGLKIKPYLINNYTRCPNSESASWGCIDWVIVGGESGPNKRPFDCDWARSIRDQCKAAGVPFFMKQVDKVQPIPDDLMIREFPRTTETPGTARTKK